MKSEHVRIVTYLESDLPKVVISGPASKRTTFALHVTGPLSETEMTNIIRVLELNLEWLREDAKSDAEVKDHPREE